MRSSSKKILNYSVVGARKSFQIVRQNTWFLEKIRALTKFLYGILILHYLISIIKLWQNHSIKKQFHINHASHLKLNGISEILSIIIGTNTQGMHNLNWNWTYSRWSWKFKIRCYKVKGFTCFQFKVYIHMIIANAVDLQG